MEILWLAIVFYSIGLALLLHFRPAMMFFENGTWKEFGYQRDARHTVFPFWLFAIVWAFVSYALAATLSWTWLAVPAAVSMSSNAFTSANAFRYSLSDYDDEERNYAGFDDEGEIENEMGPEMLPVSEVPVRRGRGRPRGSTNKPRPGYYVLDPAPRESGGLRRYVYYGSNPPAEEEF
jgi:hypothetical protein